MFNLNKYMQAYLTPMHLILDSESSSPQAASAIPGNPQEANMTGALYLGSMKAFRMVDLLREHQISHLVQVLLVDECGESESFDCYRINIMDDIHADLTSHLDPVCHHIDQVLKSGKNVLVHCFAGISRSASVVIAYLIRSKGMSYEDAHDLVLQKRACICPNDAFKTALRVWEVSCHSNPSDS